MTARRKPFPALKPAPVEQDLQSLVARLKRVHRSLLHQSGAPKATSELEEAFSAVGDFVAARLAPALPRESASDAVQGPGPSSPSPSKALGPTAQETATCLVRSGVHRLALEILSDPRLRSPALSSELSLLACNLFFCADAQLEAFLLSEDHLSRFAAALAQTRAPQPLDNLSHALGLLVGFRAANFARLESLGIFERCFASLRESLSSEVHAGAPGGVLYFLENFFFAPPRVADPHLDVVFPLLLDALPQSKGSLGPHGFRELAELTQKALSLATPKALREHASSESFPAFLSCLRSAAFDFE